MRCALLHGFAGTPAAWHDVIEAWQLPEPPRAFALPGHGGGPVQPTWDANLDAVARQIGTCDVVVGYSLGGRIALGLLASGRCSRAVLISVNPGIADDERPTRRAADAQWARTLREDGVAVFDQQWTAQPLFATQARVAEHVRATRRAHRLALDPEQLARSLDALGLAEMPDYRPQLPALVKQCVFIVGSADPKFRAIADAAGGAAYTLETGHDPTLEDPQALAKAIAHAVVRLA